MTDKITLTSLVNLQNETTAVNAINSNNAAITAAIDNTLSRDGTTPNQMNASLDMNSNRILNLPAPTSDHEPIRLIDSITALQGPPGPKGDTGSQGPAGGGLSSITAGTGLLGGTITSSGTINLNTGIATPAILVNPEVMFDQVNEGATYQSISGQEHYGPDGYRFQGTGAGSFVIQRVSTSPTGFKNGLNVQVVSQNTSPQPTDNYHVEIPLEGIRNRLFQFGTANAQTFTYQFQMAATTNGTYSVSFINGIDTRYYVQSVNYTGGGAFQQFAITVPGDTSGTWSNLIAAFGLKIIHDFGSGSTYTTAPSTSWATGAFWKASGSYSLVNQVANTQVFLSAFQIDLGSVALPFRFIPYEDQLALCQRYLRKSFPQGTRVAQAQGIAGSIGYINSNSSTTAGGGVQVQFPSEMDATPNITYYSTNSPNNKWRNTAFNTDSGTPSTFLTSTNGFLAQNPQVLGDNNLGAIMSIHYLADATLGGL